jgi:hypothetical protein
LQFLLQATSLETFVTPLYVHGSVSSVFVQLVFNFFFTAYESRYPKGSKTVLYKKAKLEKFGPYVQVDGLVTRITTYADYDWTVPEYAYEYYSNRADCLLEVRRNLLDKSVTEIFKRGRDDCLKGGVMVFSYELISLEKRRRLH